MDNVLCFVFPHFPAAIRKSAGAKGEKKTTARKKNQEHKQARGEERERERDHEIGGGGGGRRGEEVAC